MADIGCTQSGGQVAESTRVLGIDVARAIALLGIFLVNAEFFADSFWKLQVQTERTFESWQGECVYWLTLVFCTGKFFPLFSILFGAGLAILYESSRQAGRSFGWIYFRRLVVLALFGIAHIILLWDGDILLLYACLGLVMLFLGRAGPKVLLWVAGFVFMIGLCVALGFAAFYASEGEASSLDDPTEVSQSTPMVLPKDASPIRQLFIVLTEWEKGEAYDAQVISLERRIQTRGPFSNAIGLRMFGYLLSIAYFVSAVAWVVLPCFCVGAALAKSGFFYNKHPTWRHRLMLVGLIIGLPLSLLTAYALEYGESSLWIAINLVGFNIVGPLMALAYLSTILTLVERNPSSRVALVLGRLGRMGLTGYLMESFLMSAVMTHWGLAWYGTTTWAQRLIIVAVLYLCILGFANVWMRYFRFGPLEWLWRTLTYWKWQRLVQ